jgi:lipopolysaccharide transport system ATP-binding protein
MSDVAVRVNGLGKRYQLGRPRHSNSLRERLVHLLKAPARRLKARRTGGSAETEAFWALKDVSFDVREGEVVGIIGRNGAGKSTLLKILSRISEPSEGEAEISGRIGSLLEVGTGFHPELTGRENVYLNAAILGMRRTDVVRKFDDIVQFAEVDRFVDTPVKHYSSGMYMRLAFAVAAHMEPDILIVDEVLAVGDAQFQKKCLGKMGEVSRKGRTVLFVSHNMGAVLGLCQKAVWLKSGRVNLVGPAQEVVSEYGSDQAEQVPEVEIQPWQHVQGTGAVQFVRASLRSDTGASKSEFLIGEPLELVLNYRGNNGASGTGWVIVSNADGIQIASGFMRDVSDAVALGGSGALSVRLEPFGLLPGRYSVAAGLFGPRSEMLDWCDQLISFEILRHHADGQSFDQRLGIVSQRLDWRHEPSRA